MVVEVLVVLLLALAEHFGLKRYSYGLYEYISRLSVVCLPVSQRV